MGTSTLLAGPVTKLLLLSMECLLVRALLVALSDLGMPLLVRATDGEMKAVTMVQSSIMSSSSSCQRLQEAAGDTRIGPLVTQGRAKASNLADAGDSWEGNQRWHEGSTSTSGMPVRLAAETFVQHAANEILSGKVEGTP